MSSAKKTKAVWEVQKVVFGSQGNPIESFAPKMEGFGMVDIKHIENAGHEKTISPFIGEKVGEYEIDINNEAMQAKMS